MIAWLKRFRRDEEVLVKAHIRQYVKKDGTMVREHDDVRTRKHVDILRHEAAHKEEVHPGGKLEHVQAHWDHRVRRYGDALSRVRIHSDLHNLRQKRFAILPHWGHLGEESQSHILASEQAIHRELTTKDIVSDAWNAHLRSRQKAAMAQGEHIPDKDILASGLAERTPAGTQLLMFKSSLHPKQKRTDRS
jgi:hypothetical protein